MIAIQYTIRDGLSIGRKGRGEKWVSVKTLSRNRGSVRYQTESHEPVAAAVDVLILIEARRTTTGKNRRREVFFVKSWYGGS